MFDIIQSDNVVKRGDQKVCFFFWYREKYEL